MAPNDADMPDAYPLGDDLHKIAKDISGLREEFMDFCDQLNVDAIMEPVKQT